MKINHINFIEKVDISDEITFKSDQKSLYLLDPMIQFNIFDFMPKQFTILTNNGSCNFNVDMLNDTSPVISKFKEDNPHNFQYNLNIDDKKNVISIFGNMYQGKLVFFDEDDIPIAKQIANSLELTCCPFFIQKKHISHQNTLNSEKNVIIDKESFADFLRKDSFKTFTIATNKKKYKCNIFGVNASTVIRKFITENPNKNEFSYKYEDEFSEFQLICDIFNFQKVQITVENMNSLKKISEDLKIVMFSKKIDQYIEKYNIMLNKIDRQREDINSITELFDLLFRIKEKTVLYVKEIIIQSIWSETEEDVQELAAFILQAANTDFNLHDYLADLLIELDKASNDTNKLNTLLPFVVKKLMLSFGRTTFNCSLIYRLHKRGVISKEEIHYRIKELTKRLEMVNYSPFSSSSNENSEEESSKEDESEDSDLYSDQYDEKTNIDAYLDYYFQFVYLWFLPEVIEIGLFNERYLENGDEAFFPFFQFYLPDKIDEYKKMRDCGEPTDDVTKALRNDDVDLLQSIISSKQNEKFIVPFNIYENFVSNGKTNYLNYSAAYGSLKCFKYLLLNHQKCDDSTFSYAVFGGNFEIIKIVENQISNNHNSEANEDYENENNSLIDMNFINSDFIFYQNVNQSTRSSKLYKILPSIMKHQNNLFDWIFQNKFQMNKIDENLLFQLVINSVLNGNAHSLIEIIYNKGFDFPNELISEVFQLACKKGFFKLSKIIYRILNNFNNELFRFNSVSAVYFGNLSIFKFSLNLKKSNSKLERAFVLAVSKDHRNIIEYFFERLIRDGFKFSSKCINKSMNTSVMRKSSELFFYLLKHFKQQNFGPKILSNACIFGNFEAVKTILESIITVLKSEQESEINYSELDLTDQFMKAAISGSIEICQYFLDNKFSIDFNLLSTFADELSIVSEEIFLLMINNCNSVLKKQFLHLYFEPAIENKNYNLVEFLLKQKVTNERALFTAIKNDDLNMVNLILKYKNDPSFINQLSEEGTALIVAVDRNDIKIVKTLLSIPGINPSLCDLYGSTALMKAFPKIGLMNHILDFYGDSILYQTEQVHFLLKKTLHLLIEDPQEAIPVLDRLLKIKSIEINELINNENFLTFACETNNVKVFKMIHKIDNINLNIYKPGNGNTPLIIAIENNSDDVAKLLVEDPRTNINAKNYEYQTALQIAHLKGNDKIIDLLLSNEKFNPIESHLDEVFKNASIDFQMKVLSMKLFDVNHVLFTYRKQQRNDFVNIEEENENEIDDKNIFAETILNFAVRKNNIKIIDYVIHHQSFDKEESDLKTAIFTSIKNQNITIFEKLLKLLNNEINEYEFDHYTILCYAIEFDQIQMIIDILNHPNFDSKKNKMFDSFCSNFVSLKSNSYEIMKLLYKYDNEHDNLINLNKLSSFDETVFTSINCGVSSHKSSIFFNINEIVTFLLEHGSDPNLPNKVGTYPLQHAIELNSIDFVRSLLNSNKIDLSIRLKSLKNRSFLHLAAISDDSSILEEILSKNAIDINSTDDQGETPLILACKFNRKENVTLLFEHDNLDYLHMNTKGKDALKVVHNSYNEEDLFELNDRDGYYKKILKSIDERKRNDLNLSESIKNSNYQSLSLTEKFENFALFHRKSDKRNRSQKSDFLQTLSENQNGYSSSVNKPFSSDGISSLERNSKDAANQDRLNDVMGSIFIGTNEHESELTKSSQDESEKEAKRSQKSNLFQSIQTSSSASDKKRNEISLHPLNRPIESKISTPKIHSEKVSNSILQKIHLPRLNLNASPRSKFKNLSSHSEKVDSDSQYSIGVCYSLGKGVQVDKEKALACYLLAAEAGDMKAQYSAASCYSYGKGTAVDKAKAFELYVKAAEQGFDKAQFAVGHFYEFGIGGVEKNHEKAVEWYRKAASQGHRGSIKALKYK